MAQIYLPSLGQPGALLRVDGEEHHYLTRSLRVRVGERVRVSDGIGGRGLALVEAVNGEHAELRLEKSFGPERCEPLELGLCAPKGDALEEALDAACQLGVASITLLRSERGQANFEGAALRPERLLRRLRESCRQCLRSAPPRLAAPQALLSYIQQPYRGLSLMGSAQAAPALRELPGVGQAGEPVRLLIGPEGGFSPAEAGALAAAGWLAFNLGPWVLRTPQAAQAGLAGILALRGATLEEL